MDYPKFSSFEVQVTIGEGKSAVAGAEPPLRGNPIARAPSSVWSRLVDHTERREAGDTQDTQEEEERAGLDEEAGLGLLGLPVESFDGLRSGQSNRICI